MYRNYNSMFLGRDTQPRKEKATFIDKWLFGLMLLFGTLFTGFNASAQSPLPYVFSQSSGTYTALTGGTSFQSGATLATNAVSGQITIPFTFTFNGVGYTSLIISNNGFVTFGTTAPAASAVNPISISTAYDGAIAGYAFNLINSGVAGTSPDISYGMSGSDFVIQFTDLARTGISGDKLSFQIRLTQTSNVIKIVYNNWAATTTTTSVANFGQVGLRGTTNAAFLNRMVYATAPYNTWATSGGGADNGATPLQAVSTSGPGGPNCMRYNATFLPANGLTYTYTPVGSSFYQSLPYTQNFETWSNQQSVKDVPGAGVITNPATGNQSPRAHSETLANTAWGSISNGGAAATPGTAQGTTCSRFHSYDTGSGLKGYMDFYLNFSAAGTKTATFDLVNTTSARTVAVYLSTNGGLSFGSALATYNTTIAAWANQTLALGSSTSATCVLRFEYTADFAASSDIGLDNLVVSLPPALPTITSFTPNTNLCIGGGQTVTITGTNFSGTTSVKFNGVNATSFAIVSGTSITAVTPAALGAGTITVTNPAGTATSSAYTVAANPTVGVTPTSATYCSGGSAIALNATGALTYTWNGTNAGLSATTGSAVTATPTASTIVTVTGTDANSCTATATANLTFATTPAISSTTATPSTICNGNNSQLQATLTTQPSYSVSAISSPALETPGAATVTTLSTATGFPYNTSGTAGDDSYTNAISLPFAFNFMGASVTQVWASSNGYVTFTDPSAVTASAQRTPQTVPSTTAPNNLIALFWHDMDISTQGNFKYYTTGTSPNRKFIMEFNGVPTYTSSPPGTALHSGQIVLNETSNNVQLYVSASPSAIKTLGIENAAGTVGLAPSAARNNADWTVTALEGWLFAQPVITYAWTPTTFLSSTTIANPIATAVTATTAYSVTASLGTCTSAASNVTVTVVNGASITTDPVASAKCAGQTATFTVVASGPSLTYQWMKGGVDIAVAGNASAGTATLTLTNVTAADVATYSVRVASTCGSPVTSAGAALTVNALPAAVTVSGAGTFCTSTSITASNGGDGTIYFQGITSNGTSTTTASTSQTITSSGTYYFRAQSTAGCWGTEGSANVTIQSPVTVSGSGATICAGGTGSLTASATCSGFVNSGTTITGSWSAASSTANRITTSMDNSATCGFSSTSRRYTATQFQVSVTGNYIFSMNDDTNFDGMGYITTGAFTPGSCATGTWVKGDDDGNLETTSNEPVIGSTSGSGAMTLTAGVTYTLYSGLFTNVVASYTWTITPPSGGQVMLQGNGVINWYTAGGTLIGTGSPFNPVGVTNSGLADTNTPGTTTYYAACSLNSACRTPFDFVIKPNYTITASAGTNGTVTPSGATTVCSGAGQAYTITANSGYHIVDVLVGGVSQGAVGTYNFTNVTSNKTISATFAQDCVNVALTSASATASTVCAGSTTTLTYSGLSGTGASVTWTQNADGSGATYGTGTPSNPVGAGTYYAYATGTCGTPVSIQVVVASQAAPNAGTNGTLTICSSSTLTTSQLFAQLGGTPDAGGTWSPTLAGAGTYTYTVNATSPCTANATATVTVSVQTAADAGTNGTLTICSTSTLTTAQLFASLGGTPQAGGTWSPALAGAGVYTYTVNATSPCTANATATVTVTVQAAPNAGTNGTLTICSSSTLTTSQLFASLGGTPQAGGIWSPTLAGAGVYTYTVNATSPCTGNATATVTVTSQAAANAGSNGTLSICSTSTLTTAQLFSSLGGTPQAGGTWSPALAGAGIYTYTVNATSPCTTNATATVTVTVQAAPNAGSNGSLTICSGTTVTASQLFAQLTGTPSAGGTWTPALAGAGTYTYTVLATSPCTTNATAQVVVTAVSCQSAQLANCGNTPVLTSVNTRIFAANTVTTATKYRFRVAKSTAPTTYFYAETTYPSFRLTDVVGLTPTYGTTYNVDIQNEFLIGSQTVTSAYGQMCTVTTQAVTAVTVPTNQCGQTLAAINSKIYINGVTGATMYSYRIAKQSAPTVYSYIDTPYSNFRLTNAPTSGTVAIEHSTVYLVAVSVTTASGSSNYNGECQITTPDGPVTTLQASQCGDDDAPYVVATKSTKVYAADFVSGATYTFKLEQYDAQSNLVATKFATSPINYFDCNMFTGTNSLLPNTLYHVYVSINYYGQGPYDHDCVIKTPAALKQEEVTTQFSAVAYPNPFANNFMVDVKSSSQSVVNVKVYDMIGRMIDQRDVKMSDLETTTIGTNYPSGVYNVVVSQQNSVETVRVIKR